MRQSFVVMVGLLWASGCGVDTTLPDGAQVSCKSDADCLDGRHCSLILQRCVAANADEAIPELVTGQTVVTPAFLRPQVPLSVAFRVSEQLGRLPQVTLIWHGDGEGAATSAAALTSGGSSSVDFTFAFTAHDTEPEGPISVAIELVDTSGVKVNIELPRVSELDRTPPALVDLVAPRYLPEASNPLPTVELTAARDGTTVRTEFTVTEPLSLEPTVVGRNTATLGTIPFALVTNAGRTYQYATTLSAALPTDDGTHELGLELTDRAGNVNTVVADSFEVDNTPPVAPAVDTPNAVVYFRQPWGAADRGTGAAQPPAFWVAGAAGAGRGRLRRGDGALPAALTALRHRY